MSKLRKRPVRQGFYTESIRRLPRGHGIRIAAAQAVRGARKQGRLKTMGH